MKVRMKTDPNRSLSRNIWVKFFREKVVQSFENKVLLLGDTHFSKRSPKRRIDNYFKTQLRKLEQVISIGRKHKCRAILQTGDFFDQPQSENYTMAEVIRRLMFPGFDICAVAGQHDIVGHSTSTLSNSSLAVLSSAELVRIVGKKPYELYSTEDGVSVMIYGAGFGEEVPEPYEDCYNILVTHRMVGDRLLWPGQELLGPRAFLKKHSEFNLIVCGDYHYRFIEEWNGRVIINPGALVRKTISEFDLEHKPAVVVFDILTKEIKVVELNVDPIKKVFDLSRKEVTTTNKVKRSDVLAKLAKKLKQGSKRVSGWKHVLLEELERRKANKEVKKIIDETLEEVKK